MTKFSKVLVVFIAASSIAFMAFAGAISIAGPNWNTEASAEDLEDYSFESSGGEKTTYTVSYLHGKGGEPEQVKAGTAVLADAIIAARQHKLKRENEEIARIDNVLAPIEAKIKETRQLTAVDQVALQKYDKALTDRLTQMQARVDTVSKQFVALSIETQQKRIEASHRREDVFRLTNQLEILRAEIFRITEQQELLRDALYRLEGKVDTASRTNKKLKTGAVKPPYEEEE